MAILSSNGKLLTIGGVTVNAKVREIPVIPAYTIRCVFRDGITPEPKTWKPFTAVQVSSSPNIWDISNPNTDSWEILLKDQSDLIEVLNMDPGDIKVFGSMFKNCTSLIRVRNIVVNTSPLTTQYMFQDCTNLESVHYSSVPELRHCRYMFQRCANLEHSPVISIADNSQGMFENCSSLKDINLIIRPNASSNFTGMFRYCTDLTDVNITGTFGTSSIIDGMFSRCTVLTNISLPSLYGVSSARSAFEYCYGITQIPLYDTSTLTDVYCMFMHCPNVESGALALYNRMIGQENPPTSHDYTFYDCGSNTVTGAAELAQIPEGWK